MVDIRKPRRGSMAFRPRKRAESQNARVFWLPSEEKRILGFAGYKAGMLQLSYIEDAEGPTKGQEVVSAATVVEVPPLKVYGIRLYSNNKSLGDVLSEDSKMLAQVGIKKPASKPNEKDAEDVRLLVYAQPKLTSFGKKHVERMEIACGGKTVDEKLELCKAYLGKDLRFSEVFKPGEYVDLIAVTKGKGWQGAVKRFGVKTQRRKATGKVRHIGTLGPFHPAYVMYTVPQAGQMGYHKRTELNKRIMLIGDKPEEITPKSGFTNYGVLKNDYVVLKGSIPGPVKRLVKMRLGVRAPTTLQEPKVTEVIM